MINFSETGLKPEILQAVEVLGFTQPTPIQAASIPALLDSQQDIIGFAATGTGKTAAFSLPIIHHVNTKNDKVQAIILCPTRELCLQITNDIKDFTKFLPHISTVAVYGGESIDKQVRLLRRGAHIVVGTPGRVCDMLRRKILDIEAVDWVVLDEADEMLSMGFLEEMEFILEHTPKERKTLMFSATMPREIERMAQNYMKEPLRISVQKENTTTANVSHEYYVVKAKDKYNALRRIADLNPNIYAIVFCRTREDAKQIADKFIEDGYNADALHGDLSQAQRDLVMHRFRTKHLQMLIATDVAARGIDVENLTHVINMELPDNVESYIHRSGRTGRAGKMGVSLSILHTKELKRIVFFERKLGKKIERKPVPTGIEVCENQLLYLIDRMQTVQTDDEQISSFLPAIYGKLESMSKEEIIKNFVALEFNQLLQHYKGAEDINAGADRGDDRGERGYKVERREYEERPAYKKEGREGGRESREPREPREFGDKKRSAPRSGTEGGFVRLYLNVGRAQKVNPGRIIELLNSVKSLRDARVGKILIEDNYTAFDIESGFEEELLAGFRSKQISGVPVFVTQEMTAVSERVKQTSFKREEKPYGKEAGKSYGKDSKPYSKDLSFGDKKKKKKY
jgi:ATP-dependent RNA helicase DeaD